MSAVRALAGVTVALACASALACGKSPVDVQIDWYSDAAPAISRARTQNKPLIVFVGAEWDMGSKMLEHETFASPEVRALVNRGFIGIQVDATDDDDPRTRRLTERFKVIGTPTIILLAPDGVSEISRISMFVTPDVLARHLRAALEQVRPRDAP